MNEGVGSIEILGKIFPNLLLGILLFKKLLTLPYPVYHFKVQEENENVAGNPV